MIITFCNKNGYDVFLSVDGRSLKIPPYSEETVSRSDDGAMRLTVKMKTESYTEKVKRPFWLSCCCRFKLDGRCIDRLHNKQRKNKSQTL